MITNKTDYKKYVRQDEEMRWGRKNISMSEKIKCGTPWLYMKTLRIYEYLNNCRKNIFTKILLVFIKLYFRHLTYLTGWTIPINVCGPGLCIVHIGTVVISERASLGKNCRIHAGVNIGALDGKAPYINDNVYIGPGAKLYGEIEIASYCAVGANSVVNRSFREPGATIAGIPAKKVSDHGSYCLIAGGQV